MLTFSLTSGNFFPLPFCFLKRIEQAYIWILNLRCWTKTLRRFRLCPSGMTAVGRSNMIRTFPRKRFSRFRTTSRRQLDLPCLLLFPVKHRVVAVASVAAALDTPLWFPLAFFHALFVSLQVVATTEEERGGVRCFWFWRRFYSINRSVISYLKLNLLIWYFGNLFTAWFDELKYLVLSLNCESTGISESHCMRIWHV
jgi:hypothetical protein